MGQGACMVAGGHAWLLGGMCGCWGVCMVAGGACIGYGEIRSMSGWYASYWNAFLFGIFFCRKLHENGRIWTGVITRVYPWICHCFK